MQYESVTIHSFQEFHEIIKDHKSDKTVYRGVKDQAFQLIPKIGRSDYKWDHKTVQDAERYILNSFKQQSIPFLDFTPRNDWEWLAIAQHHGLPTRLLDWSRNPLVAAFFAVADETNSVTDSAIYVYTSTKYPISTDDEKKSPFTYKEQRKFIPSHINPRIIAQSGLFTIHPKPDTPLPKEDIQKIVIPNEFRKELKEILFKYDIHTFSLFPGMDGLSQHITWLRNKI